MLDELIPYSEGFYSDISSWFQARGMVPPSRKEIPGHGFIIKDLAAGFLICTDTKVCMMEFFVSNPNSDKSMRKAAISKIASALISKATALGYETIKCDSTIDAIKFQAMDLGFVSIGQYEVFIKEI